MAFFCLFPNSLNTFSFYAPFLFFLSFYAPKFRVKDRVTGLQGA
nr:MAG TPA: hypothetical protein [Caudoviricetes sp.]